MTSSGIRENNNQNTTKYETRGKVTNYHENRYWL